MIETARGVRLDSLRQQARQSVMLSLWTVKGVIAITNCSVQNRSRWFEMEVVQAEEKDYKPTVTGHKLSHCCAGAARHRDVRQSSLKEASI